MSLENPEVNKNIDILPEEQNLQTEDHKDEVFFEENNEIDIESTSERIKKFELLLGSDEVREIRNTIGLLYFTMVKMLEPVLSSIKNGEYQLIIGEDASGRIPTLIVRRFVNKIYESMGLPDIKTNFLAGSRSKYFDNASDYKYKSSEKRAAYIKHLKDTSKLDINKALVVTEYIESGSSVANIIQALDKNNIKIDLLTVANESGVTERIEKEFKEKFSSFIALHSSLSQNSRLISRSDISGVVKKSGTLHSKPIRSAKAEDIDMDYLGYFNHEQNPTSAPLFQASRAIARDEANKVADRLIEELFNSKK